jgi:hypothetical protein
MTTSARLRIEFTSYWLSGTGTARGRHLDDVCHRDRDGLPAMPMTQVKGQLRETAKRLAARRIGGWSEGHIENLFGSRTRPGERSPDATRQGALSFPGEARLSVEAIAFLKEEGRDAMRCLFRRIAGTKIDELGAAEDRTLRAVEAAVPVTLHGKVEWISKELPDPDWVARLDAACAATLAFGKLKADGYGRAIATLEPKS